MEAGAYLPHGHDINLLIQVNKGVSQNVKLFPKNFCNHLTCVVLIWLMLLLIEDI